MAVLLNRSSGFESVHGTRRQFLAAVSLIILGLLSYANSLHVPFYLDDFHNIGDNRFIQFPELSLKNLAAAAFKSPAVNRPVANLSFAANYFFHGKNLAGYHIVNIGVHILAALFLFFLIRATLATPALQGRYRHPFAIAFFSAALWLVHPLQTQSVTYIVQRMTSLAAMFYVLSLLCYARGRLAALALGKTWPWLLGAAAAGLLAFGSKEISVTLPFAILLYEWFFFQDLRFIWLKRRLPYLVAACLLLILAAILYTHGDPINSLLSGYRYREFTLPQRLLTEARVVLFYIGLFFYPHPSRLNLDHDFPLSASLTDPPTTLLAAAAVLVLFSAAAALARKERLLSFAFFWLLGNLILESSVVGLEIIFEHRMYLPSMFLCFALVSLAYRSVKPDRLVVAALGTLVLVFSLWTWQRNGMWREPVRFWTDAIQKAPANPRPYNNLSVELRRQGRYGEAIAASRHALQLRPEFVNAHVSLGMAYDEAGFPDEAIAQFKSALAIAPAYGEVYVNLGNSYIGKGEIDEAIAAFRQALDLRPDNIAARVNLAAAKGAKGLLLEAAGELEEALTYDRDNPDIHFNLGLTYKETGQYRKAQQAFKKVLRLRPEDQAAAKQLDFLARLERPGQ